MNTPQGMRGTRLYDTRADHVAEMRFALDAAVVAAHQGKAASAEYFLNRAVHDRLAAGWEQYREEFHNAALECAAALRGAE